MSHSWIGPPNKHENTKDSVSHVTISKRTKGMETHSVMEKGDLHRTSTGAKTTMVSHLESEDGQTTIPRQRTQCPIDCFCTWVEPRPRMEWCHNPTAVLLLWKVAMLSQWALLQMESVKTTWFQLATLPCMATRVLPRRPKNLAIHQPRHLHGPSPSEAETWSTPKDEEVDVRVPGR